MCECKYGPNFQDSFPLFHRLENIRHQSIDFFFFLFPSWKIQQDPLNVFPPLMFFPILLLAGYNIGSSVMQWENQSEWKRGSSEIHSVLACTQHFHVTETHTLLAKTCIILTRMSRSSQPVCPSMDITSSSWKQLLQKIYSLVTSFTNVFHLLALYSKNDNSGSDCGSLHQPDPFILG